MSDLPEHDPDFAPTSMPRRDNASMAREVTSSAHDYFTEPGPDLPLYSNSPSAEAALFQSWSQPEIPKPTRIPHLGHVALLAGFLIFGLACSTALFFVALHFHLYGVSTAEQAKSEIHYNLYTELILYFVTLILSLLIFPLFWKKSFFAGIQWRGREALRLYWQLLSVAVCCFGLALLDQVLIPGPDKAPIDEMFRSPGAAWLMFAFGVTVAPFFEEIIFRGFLLPAIATAWDWTAERFSHTAPRPLDENGSPQWSIPAMVFASIAASLPFALIHVEQQGHAIGPFVLLICVSLVLCAVRLRTRSLAASVLVHASYNFMLFAIMLVGTGGFRHLDKM
jgi:hypothetical protein